MTPSPYETLARSQLVRKYQESFPRATGFVLQLQPAARGADVSPFGPHANPFCTLMSCSPLAREQCAKSFTRIRTQAARTFAPGQSCCFAKVVHAAVPVVSARKHIATFYGGQLLSEAPSPQAFGSIARQLVELGLEERLPALEEAWLNTPVVSDREMRAIMYLLTDFAGQLSLQAATMLFTPIPGEPPAVTRAREFVGNCFARPIALGDVAKHLQMSVSGFSKIFKPKVGVTFTEYLARYRIEKSKRLLANPNAKIHDIALQSGFNCISQFNRSFKRYTDHSPSQFRDSLV